MQKTIKELTISNARLNILEGGRRVPIADFSGKIKIKLEQIYVPILGEIHKGEKKIIASFILCDDIRYQTDECSFNSGRAYEAIGDVTGESQTEELVFSGLQYDDMDPVSGTVTFEIKDMDIIQKMLTM
jgi:hypothetical protein